MLRRSLLGTLPALLVVAAVPPAGATAVAPLDLLSDPAAASRIGRACLATLPADGRHPQRLRAAVAERIGHLDPAEPRDRARARLSAAIRDDFAASRTRLVGGWVLSETECRLCALAATA